MPPLHTVLVNHGDGLEAWMEGLREVLKAEALAIGNGGSRIDVLVGATAGVRSALEANSINQTSIAALESTVKAEGGLNGGTASFKLISGDEEAAMELVAARHCLLGSSKEGAALVASSEGKGRGGVGLLSSGGASSQVAFVQKNGKDVRTISLPTHIKKANAACLEKGVAPGIAEYRSYLASLVADLKATECFVGKLKGTFVCIEVLSRVTAIADTHKCAKAKYKHLGDTASNSLFVLIGR